MITSGAMTAVLDRLEKIGLIFRTPEPKDGRVKIAVLTKNGKNVIDKAIAIRFDEVSSGIEAFEMKEKKQLSQLLKKMVLTLEKEQFVEISSDLKIARLSKKVMVNSNLRFSLKVKSQPLLIDD